MSSGGERPPENVSVLDVVAMDSLRLKIHTADGYVLGLYFDNADGTTDGRINLDITNPNGIAKGIWYYEVYGYSLNGTEDYYI